MITKVKIRNFQGIGEEIEIPLSKLNLFFGPNAAGKSSIGRAMKFFGDYVMEYFPTAKSMVFAEVIASVDHGEFENFVHNHKIDETISIEWEFDITVAAPTIGNEEKYLNWQKLVDKVRKQYLLSTLRGLGQDIELDRKNDDGEHVTETVHLGRIHIPPIASESESENETETFTVDARVRLEISSPGVVTFFGVETDSFYMPNVKLVVPKLSLNMETQYEHPDQVWALEGGSKLDKPLYVALFNEMLAIAKSRKNDISDFAKLKNKTIEAAIDSQFFEYGEGGLSWHFTTLNESKWRKHDLVYNEFTDWQASIYDSLREQLSMKVVGPLREIPEAILDKANEIFGESSEEPGRFDEVYGFHLARKWFQRLTNGFDFEVTPLTANGLPTNFLKLDLITPSKVRINFKDAGVGLGQILPVLVYLFPKDTDLLNKIGAQVWIEQPEIHLHPKMQSELADAFIDHAKNYIFKRQLFIETHSENLVLRLLRRIRETYFGIGESKLYPEDVSIIFVGNDGNCTNVTRLDLMETGEMVQSWPIDFVEIRMDDIL